MKFPKRYVFLNSNSFSLGEYCIVPIRYVDRMDIMKWRNEQIYHLRQKELLTEEGQEYYFKNIVSKLFEEEQPNQILFSYLKNDICIGYGGLVHINWIDKNAEISFIMDTSLEDTEFELHWTTYLKLIEIVAFKELSFHKLFTYAFDLRPHLYQVIEKLGFVKEAVLKESCLFDGVFKDIVIHSKYKKTVSIRPIDIKDIDFTYLLSNDSVVRENSFNKENIPYLEHEKWFVHKINDENSFYFIGEFNRQPAAFLRIDIREKENVIGIAVDKGFRGKKLAVKFLELISEEFVKSGKNITAYIKKENTSSIKSFERAGFLFEEECNLNGVHSKKYIYGK